MTLATIPRATTYPRLGHVKRHVKPDLWPVLELMLEAITMDEMAERIGPGTTRRYVETRATPIVMVLPLHAERSPLFRLALLRVVMGLDPCWCEQ